MQNNINTGTAVTYYADDIRVYYTGTVTETLCTDDNSYRYGFQAQEKDNELYGTEGTAYAFEYRIHDARLGRFFSVDPYSSKFPWNSSYAFSENRLLDGVELEGREVILIHGDARFSAYVTGSVSTGLALDFQGNVGWFLSPSFGAGVIGGWSAGGGISVYPTARNINQLSGWGASAYVSGIFGYGLSFSYDVAMDIDNLKGYWGLTGSFGAGEEVGAAGEVSYTWIFSTTWKDVGSFFEKYIDRIKEYRETLTTLEYGLGVYSDFLNMQAINYEKTDNQEKANEFRKQYDVVSNIRKEKKC